MIVYWELRIWLESIQNPKLSLSLQDKFNVTLIRYRMKTQARILIIIILVPFSLWNTDCIAQLAQEQPLWSNGIPNNPVRYKEEKLRTYDYLTSSLSQMNRVYSCISVPTYIIHKAEKSKNTGVALVICPGGGFRDVWFDREGNDLGLWLARKGITSLVLKYRTFNSDEEGFTLKRNVYDSEVYTDAKQAIYILRSNARELNIDENKIGIAGFSAGGSLSLITVLEMHEKELPAYADFNKINTKPDFAGLFYPGLNPGLINLAGSKDTMPPVFMINGGQDNVTPAGNCIELFKVLTSRHFNVELHIYAIGQHGFDSGEGRGYGISTWRDTFIAWLKDTGFIKE
jgi:acetyl esterase/lipase